MASLEATTQLKRQREEEEAQNPQLNENKKPKTHNQFLSILDDDGDDEPSHDISSLISSLRQEIAVSDAESTSFGTVGQSTDPEENPSTVPVDLEDSSSPSTCSVSDEDEKERVMRRLLEASDDELGIPGTGDGGFDGEEVAGEFCGGDGVVFCDGLWELEDEAANYYTLLQSELFM